MQRYLDHAATSPVRREALEAMWPYLSAEFGNPSSHHEQGARAGHALEWAREQVAGVLGCRRSEIIFTGGGTESNNFAVKGAALALPRGRHVAVSAVEHPSVLESVDYLERLHGFSSTMINVDAFGQVTAEAAATAIRSDTALVSVMLANNEVGTVNPVAEIAAIARDRGAIVHTDAVQAAGWLPLDPVPLGVDLLTIAGHKIGAPKGIGVLYCRAGTPLEPLIHGGGQERGRRSGTANVAGAVGLATALVLAESERGEATARLVSARDALIHRVLAEVPGARLTGHASERLPTNASFCFEGTSGEAVLLELEQRGITVSSGSACAAGSSEPSTVLTAMGISPDLALTAVRLTFGASFTEDDADAAVAAIGDAVRAVRGIAE